MKTLAASSPLPSHLVQDATKLYWTWNGGVSFVKKDGSATAQMDSGGAGSGIAVDGQYVYWASHGGGGQGELRRVPLQGGNGSPIASAFVFGMAIDATTVYFGRSSNNAPLLSRLPIGGGSIVDVPLTPLGTINDVAVDGTSVYWTESTIAGALRSMPKGGGQVVDLATNTNPGAIAIDATYVFWTRQSGTSSELVRTPLGGGSTIALTSGNLTGGLALDAQYVYFARVNVLSKASILRISKQGGQVDVLYTQTNSGNVYGLVVDDSSIYYINGSPAEIRSLTPK